MKIAFRVDASIVTGSGHVMRCLTLADALTAKGAECVFISRAHPGNLNSFILDKGYKVYPLSVAETQQADNSESGHGHWLGATQPKDVADCSQILAGMNVDWLIVDHYGIDAYWEKRLKPFCKRLMVVDDLADRSHCCDLLLDQNAGRLASDYFPLLQNNPALLIGAQFTLLRPEFLALRKNSLSRRGSASFRKILVSLGGVDKDNVTAEVLNALAQTDLPEGVQVQVIMGSTAPWIEAVREQAIMMPYKVEVLVAVSNMAERMADVDLAIGAAGTSSWERCCLGLPTILLVLADNQKPGATFLHDKKAALLVNQNDPVAIITRHITKVINIPSTLTELSRASSTICDGGGTQRVVEKLIASL